MTIFELQAKWMHGNRRFFQNSTKTAPLKESAQREEGLTLADIPARMQARIVSISQRMPANQRAHLQAYGLIPGRMVKITQRSPVTVVRIEQMELALETELAGLVLVEDFN